MGSGKVVPWEKFEGVMRQPEKLEILDPPSQNARGAPPFKIVRHRHIKKSSVKADFSAENENQDRSSVGKNKPDDMLFPCPEEGCVKAYSRFANLQTHLDTGKHQLMLEQETLNDRAKREYSSKLTEGFSRIQSVQVTVQTKYDGLPPLPTGWALRIDNQEKNAFYKETDRILNRAISKGGAKWTEKRSTGSFESNELSKGPSRGTLIST